MAVWSQYGIGLQQISRTIFIEHLNMLMIDNLAEFREVEADLFEKYSDKAPKAILLLGNSSLLLRDGLRAHWGDISIVVCTEEKYIGPDLAYIDKKPVSEKEQIPLIELADSYNMTVIQSEMFLQDNISLMRRMIPDMKKVILIGDGRYINQQLDYDLRNLLMRSYPDMKYDFFSAMDMTKEELLHRLNNIDPVTTGVLFSSWFNKSHYAGSTLLTTNSFQDITNVSVPVFALQQASMNNNGIIGGYFYDKQTFQSWLQQTLENVLEGKRREIFRFIFLPMLSLHLVILFCCLKGLPLSNVLREVFFWNVLVRFGNVTSIL